VNIFKQRGHMGFGLAGWIFSAMAFLLSPAGVVPVVATVTGLAYLLFASWKQYRRVGRRFSFYQIQFEIIVVALLCATAWMTSIGTLFSPPWVVPAVLSASPIVVGFWPLKARGGYEGMGRLLLVLICIGAAAMSWVTLGLQVFFT
jgi:hypothetical protein